MSLSKNMKNPVFQWTVYVCFLPGLSDAKTVPPRTSCSYFPSQASPLTESKSIVNGEDQKLGQVRTVY